jgi:hypothetical protein
MRDKEMGDACGTYGEERNTYSVLWRNRKDRDHLEGLGKYGTIILK